MATDPGEILVLVEKIEIILYRHSGNEAVGASSDGDAFFSQDKEHPGGLSIGLFSLGDFKKYLRFQIFF